MFDNHVQDHLSNPFILALYLALGWTQATITWKWPESETWYAIFQGEPPAHWLARAHYELCWLVYEPKNEDHQKQLDSALQRGLEDADLNPIAQEMRHLLT